jgi:FKBP-type peptidyl-prolyl cis-trans isomerase FklB
MDRISYALGLGIGQQIKSMNIENFSIEDFAKSISDVIEGKETAFSSREAQAMLQEFFAKKQKEEAAKEQQDLFTATQKKDDIFGGAE